MSVRRSRKRKGLRTETWRGHKYQMHAVARGLRAKFQAFFLDPGLGKTTIILKLFQILQRAGLVKSMLVVAPLRPCYLVWPKEIKKWSNFKSLSHTVLHEEWREGKSLTPQKDIYIINPEGLKWLAQKLKGKHKENWPFDMLVIDESTKFKSMSSVRWSLLKPLLPKFKRRYILSGTPTPNSLLDIQGQLAIVDLGETFGLTIGDFRFNFFTPFGDPKHKRYKIASKNHEELLYRKASKYVLRMSTKDGNLKLPKRVDNPIWVNLPKKARKHYDQIENEYFTTIDEHGLFADLEVQKRIKCHQLANGQIYSDLDPLLPEKEQERKTIYVHRAKLDALQDLREELGGKPLLIGYAFRHDLQALQKEFGRELTTMGGASMKECERIEKRWNAGKIDLLACYPGSAALGLNLQQCGQDVVWYSLVDNWEDYHQFILRLERQGSAHTHIRNHQLLARDTLDEILLQNVKRKHGEQFKFLERVQEYRRHRVNKESLALKC